MRTRNTLLLYFKSKRIFASIQTKEIFVILLLLILGLFLILGYAQAVGQAYRVKDINPGPAHAGYGPLFELNGTIYFSADDGSNGRELWKSDGTETGTVMVKNINPFTNDPNNGNSVPRSFAELNNHLYFAANGGDGGGWVLWKSDGTEAGTVLVTSSGPGADLSDILNLTNINGMLYFMGYSSSYGRELWKSDGTANGTILVKDINPGGDGSPFEFRVVNGNIVFSANDGTNGTELWRSDGTLTGTAIVADINPNGSSNPGLGESAEMNGDIFFSATDDVHGYELWKSDGTTAGTSMVKDINTSGDTFPTGMTNINGVLYFITRGCDGWSKLWKSDGTAAGTVMIKEISPINVCNAFCSNGNCTPRALASLDGIFYFAANDGVNGFELWKSDGTITGTVMLKDIYPGPNSGFGWEFLATVVDGILYVVANDETSVYQLWQSNGTPEGTFRLTNINPNSGGLFGWNVIKMNDTLFFTAADVDSGSELWALPLETNPGSNANIIYLPIIIK